MDLGTTIEGALEVCDDGVYEEDFEACMYDLVGTVDEELSGENGSEHWSESGSDNWSDASGSGSEHWSESGDDNWSESGSDASGSGSGSGSEDQGSDYGSEDLGSLDMSSLDVGSGYIIERFGSRCTRTANWACPSPEIAIPRPWWNLTSCGASAEQRFAKTKQTQMEYERN